MNRQWCCSSAPQGPRAVIVVVAVFVGLLQAGVVGAAPSAGCRSSVGDVVAYRPPVASPIVDGFRLDNGRYGAGNRGLEYRPGQPTSVGAMADGEVVFAGQVAGQLYVTLCHADGRRSSYSYLESVAVGVGDPVIAGMALGLAGERLHVGVREGREYIDPEPLMVRGRLRVHLVAEVAFGRSGGRTSPPNGGANPGGVLLEGAVDPLTLRTALRSTVGLGRPLR